jgi:hypothetical protein
MNKNKLTYIFACVVTSAFWMFVLAICALAIIFACSCRSTKHATQAQSEVTETHKQDSITSTQVDVSTSATQTTREEVLTWLADSANFTFTADSVLLGDMIVYKPSVNIGVHKPIAVSNTITANNTDSTSASQATITQTSREDSITDNKSNSEVDNKTTAIANPNTFPIVMIIVLGLILLAVGYYLYRRYKAQSN